jgi:class 3 adenylate cyclase
MNLRPATLRQCVLVALRQRAGNDGPVDTPCTLACLCGRAFHTGEIELMGRNIGGIAVHAAARVMAQSGSNEVLVSRVVTDLVAGTGLKFSDRGSYELKGVPGR